jgi:hypothetical protein
MADLSVTLATESNNNVTVEGWAATGTVTVSLSYTAHGHATNTTQYSTGVDVHGDYHLVIPVPSGATGIEVVAKSDQPRTKEVTTTLANAGGDSAGPGYGATGQGHT